MTRMLNVAGLSCMLMGACAVRATPGDATGDGSSTGGADGGESSGVPTTGGAGSTEVPPGSATTDATSTSSGTTGGSTGAGTSTGGETCGPASTTTDGEVRPCDVFKQDCAPCEKCAAYVEGGGTSWNALKCVPVQGDDQPGDPCTAEGMGLSGFDSCAKGGRCWDVDEMGQGTCVELCMGNEAAPTCSDDENFNCATCTGECLLNLCLPACDPLIQGCTDGHVCIPVGDTFVCVVDGSGEEGQVFDPCEFANACDKGLLCLNPSAGVECDPNAGGCCLPLCDVSDPNVVCPGVGQECISLWEEGMAPPDYEKVGLCVIPG